MPVMDAKLMTRTTGNLTNSESSSGVIINGTGVVKGMSAFFAIPSTTGTTNQWLPRVWVSADDSAYYLHATYHGGAQSWASGGKQFIVPFKTDKKYAKTELVRTGSTGTPNQGVAKVGFVDGHAGYDWSRAVSFE